MDTDSAYIALAGDSIDDLVTKQHREHYFRHRSEWLPAECCDKHEDDYVQTRPDSSRRTPVDSHRGVLPRAQGLRQADAGTVQG